MLHPVVNIVLGRKKERKKMLSVLLNGVHHTQLSADCIEYYLRASMSSSVHHMEARFTFVKDEINSFFNSVDKE